MDDSKTKDYVDNNSTLSPRITDSSPRILKWKFIRRKTMFLKPRGAIGQVKKIGVNIEFFIFAIVENCL